MILVTGAAGKTGQAVLRALAAQGRAARGLVRTPAKAELVLAAGAVESIAGDMIEEGTLAAALRGCTAVYFIAPNMHPHEFKLGQQLIAAARAHGEIHLVYHSVLHPQTAAMPHHWQKMRVEEALIACGLPFTILQPAAYMQNILAGWAAVTTSGDYAVPYPVTARISLVDLLDIGAAAARVLMAAEHYYATYELAGTPPLAQTAVAHSLSEALGRPVRAREIHLDHWEASARANGLAGYALDTLLKMFRYYAQHGLEGNPHVLTWLLGRRPYTLHDFIKRHASNDSD